MSGECKVFLYWYMASSQRVYQWKSSTLEGFQKEEEGCGQGNPILMSVHSNQIEADKNTMKGVDDEAADYELLWQRCSRYQWQWPWLLFLLMLAWCQCSRIVKLLAFMLRVAIWANWQNFRQIWDKTGVDNNLRKFSQQFPGSSAVRGLHCRRTENVFNLRIGRSPTI